MDTITRTTGGRLARLAGWAQRHRWLAVALWALVLIGVTFTSRLAGSAYHDDNSLPGTESQQVVDLLKNTAQPGASAQIVFKADGGLAAQSAAVENILGNVRLQPHVRSVTGPFDARRRCRKTAGSATPPLPSTPRRPTSRTTTS